MWIKNWRLPIFRLTNNHLPYHKAKILVLNWCFFHPYTYCIESGHLLLHKRTMKAAESILISCFSTNLETGTSLSYLLAQTIKVLRRSCKCRSNLKTINNIRMKNKFERNGLIPRLILLINAVFIIAMIFLNTAAHTSSRQEPCANSKKLSVDALNSISIKLM